MPHSTLNSCMGDYITEEVARGICGCGRALTSLQLEEGEGRVHPKSCSRFSTIEACASLERNPRRGTHSGRVEILPQMQDTFSQRAYYCCYSQQSSNNRNHTILPV